MLQHFKDKTEEPVLPRYRKARKRLDDGSHPHTFEDPKSYFRQQYFESLETLTGEIKQRFNQKGMDKILAIDRYFD